MSGDFPVFQDFKYFGIYIDAYTNEKGEVKKNVYMPSSSKLGKEYCNVSNSFLDKVFNKNTGTWIEPNGIAIITEKSNLAVIDIDKPDECVILNRLLKDCKFYVKTRKGFHFYFNNTDQLPRRKLCGIADINTNILYYAPEYKHIDTNEVYNYELIKSKKLVDMPQYAIDWCLTIISVNKKIETKPKTKTNIENIVIFNNVTSFNDLIFNKVTSLRQQRFYVKGNKTAEWNGTMNAAGFIINDNNVQEWKPNQKYTEGVIVKYKNKY